MIQAIDVELTYQTKNKDQSVKALDGLSLDIEAGEFICIVGPSGCGKTSFLHAIDGLIPISSGEIYVNNKLITESGEDSSMVFQSPSLLPWRTVLGNVAYGMELKGWPKAERLEKARHLLEIVGLQDFANHYPSQLSGGMQQRANVARALSVDPKVLLLDEPFGALDAMTREQLQDELLRIWSETDCTAVFVTHSIDESIYLSDRIVVITQRPGRIKEIVPVNLPRPRTLEMKQTKEYRELVQHVWTLLHN